MKRPQFSLRTLLIAATIASLLLALALPFAVAAYKRWTAKPVPTLVDFEHKLYPDPKSSDSD